MLLLKTAALCVGGRLSESVIDEGLEAIRHHNPAVHGPIRNPITYFHAVVSEKTGGVYAALLADLTVPADLANPPRPSKEDPL